MDDRYAGSPKKLRRHHQVLLSSAPAQREHRLVFEKKDHVAGESAHHPFLDEAMLKIPCLLVLHHREFGIEPLRGEG
jgi:hypothetical protein